MYTGEEQYDRNFSAIMPVQNTEHSLQLKTLLSALLFVTPPQP